MGNLRMLYLLLLASLSCSRSPVHGRQSTPISFRVCLRIRGGSGSGNGNGQLPNEFHQTMFPPQGNQQQQMLARPAVHVRIESQPYYATTSSWGKRSTQTPLQRIFSSAKSLHQTSPTLSLVTLMSLLVYIAWQIPAFHGLLQSFFVCSGYNIHHGRLLCILLSAVSHASATHLLVNLFAYLTLGPSLLQTLNATHWHLFPFVLGAALAGSMAFLIRDGADGGCMGLSGVTLAMMAFQAKLFPDKEFRMVLAVFPITLKADMFLTVMLIWSVIGSVAPHSKVAHITHLGGLLFGMGYYEVWLRRNKLKWYVSRGKAALPKMRDRKSVV